MAILSTGHEAHPSNSASIVQRADVIVSAGVRRAARSDAGGRGRRALTAYPACKPEAVLAGARDFVDADRNIPETVEVDGFLVLRPPCRAGLAAGTAHWRMPCTASAV